jgi:hypothetical protein
MFYMDPPYNTGNDFIYPDNFTETLETYLQYTGQVDAEGRKFSNNTEADGRFHSKWLNMMYPRLFLARNLLREDGVLMCSISDKELPRANTSPSPTARPSASARKPAASAKTSGASKSATRSKSTWRRNSR